MRILTNEECLLVAGGYMSGSASSQDPGLYMVQDYWDNWEEETPVTQPTAPPPSLAQDPFFQALGAQFATNDDARALAELFASTTYTVGEVNTVTTGAYQGSGPAWGGIGEDFMFAVNMYAAFQNHQMYNPDQSVMAALDAAGVGYSVGADGSIYAPGYGYAVAADAGFTHASTVDYGTSQYESGGYSNTVLIVGQPTQSTLFGIPMFGDETIVVTGELRQAQAQAGLGILGGIAKDLLVEGFVAIIEAWLTQEPDTSRQQMRERLAQMESNVQAQFDPGAPLTTLSMPMRDGSIMSGVLQNNRFFVDANRNGLYDVVFVQNPSTGQLYVNYGNGHYVPTGNPFAVRGW